MSYNKPQHCTLTAGILWGSVVLIALVIFSASAHDNEKRSLFESGFPAATVVNATSSDGSGVVGAHRDLRKEVEDLERKVAALETELSKFKRLYRVP